MLDPEIIWAAGFFDGEGCVTIPLYRRKAGGPLAREQYSLQVTVTQNRREPLERFLRWGGRIQVMSQPEGKKITRPILRWIAEGRSAMAFLDDVEPWLAVKTPLVPWARMLQATMNMSRKLDGNPEAVADMLAHRASIRAAVQSFNHGAEPDVAAAKVVLLRAVVHDRGKPNVVGNGGRASGKVAA